MLYHYTYDGYHTYDMSNVKPCSTSEIGMKWMEQFAEENRDYEWETDDYGFLILKRNSKYDAYDYYGLEGMTMDQEIDEDI